MSETLERIRSEAEHLDPEEREQLVAALSYSNRDHIELTRYEAQIFDSIVGLAESRIPRRVFLSKYGARKFKLRAQELLDYIAEARPFLRPPQVSGLIDKCLTALASELRSREIPVTPATMMNSMGMLRTAMDARFPGYAAAKCLHRLVPPA
jgi:hypothetical protein